MRYLLLIYTAERPEGWSEEEGQAEMRAYRGFVEEIETRGIARGGEALQGSGSATTVRVRNDAVLTTDGPFAETKEVLGGFFLVECKDLDEAIEVAAKIPSATRGSIEVRPILELAQE